MEHIVRSLNKAPELDGYIEEGFEDAPEEQDDGHSVAGSERTKEPARLTSSRSLASLRMSSRRSRRSFSPVSSLDGKAFDGEKVTPEMESRFFGSPADEKAKRFSALSMVDVADRHLRDKTDAIANIIRNISEQCAAAVEGLQLAHNAEQEEEMAKHAQQSSHHPTPSEDGLQSLRTDGSEVGEGASETGYDESSYLSPDYKHSSIPPTPDLEHNRSSTSMSINSLSTTPDRTSMGYAQPSHALKIVQGDDESERGSDVGQHPIEPLHKSPTDDIMRPSTARIVS